MKINMKNDIIFKTKSISIILLVRYDRELARTLRPCVRKKDGCRLTKIFARNVIRCS